jgi:hypothetical protein
MAVMVCQNFIIKTQINKHPIIFMLSCNRKVVALGVTWVGGMQRARGS